MVLLPFLTFKNCKQKTQSFVILFLSPNSRLTGRQHPLLYGKKRRNFIISFYIFYLFILLVQT